MLGAAVAFHGLPAARAAEDTRLTTRAADHNSYRLFDGKLADDGDWFQSDDYGYVFQPRVAMQDKTWRPYTDGYWAQTDAGWSPAYVSWRVSKDHKHVGWAPLPPEARVTRDTAIDGWVDSAYDVGPDAYTFIETDQFGVDSYRTHLLPAEQSVTIFGDTENVTRMDDRTVGSRSVLYAGGPDVTIVREGSGRPVRELRLETRAENVEFFQRGDRRHFAEVSGNQFVVVTAAPDVITPTSIRVSQPARINRRLNNFTVDRGYQGIRDPQQVERIRASIRSQSPRPPEQVEREANATIHRNAPAERGGQPGRNDAAPNTPRPEATPASTATREGSPSPANGREHPQATPATTPRRETAESPTPSPGASRNGRERPTITPGAQERAAQSPTPASQKHETPAREREATPPATPHREANASEEKAARPEATPRATATQPERRTNKGGETTPRREEPSNPRAEGEKKAAPTPGATTAAPRRETERSAPAGEGKERANKPEAAPSGTGEKDKATPKP